MDMALFGIEDFSFDDMACDVIAIGPVRQGDDFTGEAAWQSILLSPLGYEVYILDSMKTEEDRKWLKKAASSYGIYVEREIGEYLKKCKVISVSGLFEEDSLPTDQLLEIFQTGAAHKAVICVDPGRVLHFEEDRKRLEILAPYIDIILPNEEEARRLTGQDFLPQMAETFLDMGIARSVITLGRDGCFVREKENRFAMGAIPGQCKNEIGVGANFTAGFIHGLFQDWMMKTKCEYACGCATASMKYDDPVEGARERKEEIKLLLKNPYL